MACPDRELSVLFVDDQSMRELNRRFRSLDRTTDVLSFPMQEGPDSGINPFLLGDVVICADAAGRQARSRKHTVEKEVDVLLIHGVLHLLGYDHVGLERRRREMRQRERELLGILSGV